MSKSQLCVSPSSFVFFLSGEDRPHYPLVPTVLPLSQRVWQYWGECCERVHLWRQRPECSMTSDHLQEMYERTSQARGESLEPNPFSQGEYIEHKHAPISCYNEIHHFPMLRVGVWPSALQCVSTLMLVPKWHCGAVFAEGQGKPTSCLCRQIICKISSFLSLNVFKFIIEDAFFLLQKPTCVT